MEQITALAARYRVPTLYPWREATAHGGLMRYGVDIEDAFRLGGVLAGKILAGQRSAELTRQATKIQLVLNLKTAKTLGITFPPSPFARADEVIE
jgi:putative ABC transport system substrate-binding protein